MASNAPFPPRYPREVKTTTDLLEIQPSMFLSGPRLAESQSRQDAVLLQLDTNVNCHSPTNGCTG